MFVFYTQQSLLSIHNANSLLVHITNVIQNRGHENDVSYIIIVLDII